jgi:DNA gyrase subunit A
MAIEDANKIDKREITSELKESYLDYAMSVIVSRALPDVRDGLKPVQRRILWGMWDAGVSADAKFRKSADVVGEVMGKYHPHGDSSIYQTIVRMVQDFSFRYPLCIGQGNWGSVDGDEAAAMRYTETKLARVSEGLLNDIDKETVDWAPNYSGTKQEPKFLPAKLPQLLLNGTVGIAVGMATNIPPHNLNEVIDATLHLSDNPKATTEDLLQFIKGPDFPTGGIIYNKKDIAEAYASGKGAITMRGVAEIKEREKGKGFNIEITEIPYQVNKSELIIKMAELVGEKRLDGVRDIRDESDKNGMSIVIELKNDASPQKTLNQLFNHTDLQKNFNVNMVALTKNGLQPEVMSLKGILEEFLAHRKNVVIRRAEYDLKKAKEREHILIGLDKALSVIDKIIATIKKSANRDDAHKNLVKNFQLSDLQASAILEMKLSTLAALERKKIEDELAEKQKLIAELNLLLKSPAKILKVIKDEMEEMKKKYGDERRTRVIAGGLKDFAEEDLIPQEDAIITLSQGGYIKRLPPGSFKPQHRGGKGLIGSDVEDEDFLAQLISAKTHDNILFFTDKGRVFQTKVYEIPAASRQAKGKPVHNFLDLPTEEKVSAMVTYNNEIKNEGKSFLAMATVAGMIKKTPLKDFDNVRRNGIIAIGLKKGDALKWVSLTKGADEIILTTSQGQAIHFKESQVRPMGRTASGVRAIKLKGADYVSSMNTVGKDQVKEYRLLVVMSNGFGKQTPLTDYKVQGRGGSGIKTAKVTPKTGVVMDARVVSEEKELLALSAKGQVIRTDIESIRTASRATQGVRIMHVADKDKVIGIICF